MVAGERLRLTKVCPLHLQKGRSGGGENGAGGEGLGVGVARDEGGLPPDAVGAVAATDHFVVPAFERFPGGLAVAVALTLFPARRLRREARMVVPATGVEGVRHREMTGSRPGKV